MGKRWIAIKKYVENEYVKNYIEILNNEVHLSQLPIAAAILMGHFFIHLTFYGFIN